MRQIEQVEINGISYNLLDRRDLLDLIGDHMGSQVAALLENELKEMQEDHDEQLEELQDQVEALQDQVEALQDRIEALNGNYI